MFHLSRNCRNLTVNLIDVPDYALDWFIQWHNESVKEPLPFDPRTLIADEPGH